MRERLEFVLLISVGSSNLADNGESDGFDEIREDLEVLEDKEIGAFVVVGGAEGDGVGVEEGRSVGGLSMEVGDSILGVEVEVEVEVEFDVEEVSLGGDEEDGSFDTTVGVSAENGAIVGDGAENVEGVGSETEVEVDDEGGGEDEDEDEEDEGEVEVSGVT